MGRSRLQPIFLVYFQYKTTQSIVFTTPNSVYCLSNIATATATEVSLLKKRFNFFLFHQIHPVSSVIELQSHFKWSIHFYFEIDFCSMTILWQIIYSIRFLLLYVHIREKMTTFSYHVVTVPCYTTFFVGTLCKSKKKRFFFLYLPSMFQSLVIQSKSDRSQKN